MASLARSQYREIPIQLVDDPTLASRTDMDDVKMEELVASIRENGIIQNVTLVARGERFEVVAGHRRTVAARRAGLPFLPAMVFPADHPGLRVIQAHENGRREDVNPVDEAFWFAELLEQECGGDVEKLAGMVGEKLNYVLNRLDLLQLDDDTRAALRADQIKIGVAKELMKIPALDWRKYYLEHAVKSGSTVSVVSGWVIDWKNTHGREQPQSPEAAAMSVIVPGPAYNPHECYICGKTDPRFIPEQIAVHTHCKHALLDPMLDQARGGSDGA